MGLVLLGFLVLVDVVIPRDHLFFPWDAVPGFYALFGFLATVLIIVFSKAVGHLFLMKREDYYDH